MKRSIVVGALLLSVHVGMVSAVPALSVSSGGASTLTASPGDTVPLQVVLSGLGAELATSGTMDVSFSAGGLQYDSYLWTLPFVTGSGDDLSVPNLAALPALVTDDLFGPAGSAVDIHFDNFTSAGGVGNAVLVTTMFQVPCNFSGPATITINTVPGEFVFNDSPFAETPLSGPAFVLNIQPVAVVDVALRAVSTPTTPEQGGLPTSLTTVCSGDSYFLEVWVSQNCGADGVAGGSVDLLFDNTLVTADLIDHGSVYSNPSSGTINNGLGVADDVGGATLLPGVGVTPNWALFARVRVSASGAGIASFSMVHGAFPFALAGGMPPLPNSAVDVTDLLSVTVPIVDDGNACTTDSCAAGVVTNMPVVCTALDQCHVAGVCNPGTGVCTDPNMVDGTLCDDSDFCTQTDACQLGICTGSNPVVCTALDQCHVAGVCNPGTGVCTDPNIADGTLCNDSDFCTQTDSCQLGVCAGGAPLDCNDLNACTQDSCVAATGCVNSRIIYDLDTSNTLDAGDFALFAPHYATFTGDPAYLDCADFYFDGQIGPSDVSFFGTAFGRACGDVMIVQPDLAHLPPSSCPGMMLSLASPGAASQGEPVTVELRTVVRDSRTAFGVANRPPPSWGGSVELGQLFVVEIWVHMFGADAAGVTGGSVTVSADAERVSLMEASVDPNFGIFATGEIDPMSGTAFDLGGVTLDGFVAVKQWVRFATVEFRSKRQGPVSIQLDVGSLRFAQFSVGLLPDEFVIPHGVDTQVGAYRLDMPVVPQGTKFRQLEK